MTYPSIGKLDKAVYQRQHTRLSDWFWNFFRLAQRKVLSLSQVLQELRLSPNTPSIALYNCEPSCAKVTMWMNFMVLANLVRNEFN